MKVVIVGIKVVLTIGLITNLALSAGAGPQTNVIKPSFSDRFKSNLSSAGSSIKSGFQTVGSGIKSGAQTIGSGIKTGTKGALKTASKVSKIVQPYAEGAFALGQSALEHKNAQTLAREEHQRMLEASKAGHLQSLEIMRAQQEHEFKMKQMDIEIEKMRLQNNPAAESRLLREREQEMQNFEDFMEEFDPADSSSTNEEM